MSTPRPEDYYLAERARDFALEHHTDQKYGDKPYIYHLDMVGLILSTFNFHGDVVAAGLLHDVIEDTHVTLEDVDAKFGPKVSTLVWAVTGTGANRRECNESIYQKLELVPAAIPVKLSDRIANVECAKNGIGTPSLYDRYLQEHDEFSSRIRKNSSLMTAVMWRRLNEAFGVSP
jgi:guanosine-3',5'-bis(diphosphate) 3'-pyrophosphohydrolase